MREYSDFTLYLYQRYRQTHKRFIVSNWEGDNVIYCGQAYDVATHPDMEASCRDNYLRTYGVASPEAALEGLKLWLQVRADGILDGRRRALNQGIGGMRVYYAPEFNIVRILREHGLKSVLYDVIPSVMFDYVSYSAYESINGPDPAASLTSDLDLIQQVAGSSAIIVGETGFSRRDWQGDEVRRTAAVIDAALDWGVPYLIQWCLYDSDPLNLYGLYDVEGAPTNLAVWFQERFHPLVPLRKFCREDD
jgi:hypothetical protein